MANTLNHGFKYWSILIYISNIVSSFEVPDTTLFQIFLSLLRLNLSKSFNFDCDEVYFLWFSFPISILDVSIQQRDAVIFQCYMLHLTITIWINS